MSSALIPSCLAGLTLLAAFAVPAGGASSSARAFLFDLGPSNSIVRPGWTQVTEKTVYTKGSGSCRGCRHDCGSSR